VRPADVLIGGLLLNEQPGRVASVTAVRPDAPDDEAVGEIVAATTSNPADGLSARRVVEEDSPAAFFEQVYQATAGGAMQLPWDRPAPHPLLVDWATKRGVTGEGQRAVVVGCGLGVDAEYVAGLGFDTVAFDVSETAVDLAKRQNPDSSVWYMAADLINLPRQWRRTFDLVVEIYTVQALPDPPRADAIANIAQLVGPGGTLLAIAFVGQEYRTGGFPPWPLTSVEINAFAANGLTPVAVEQLPHAGSPNPQDRLWRAELRRFDPVVPR
jgi:SAM-dependent methyltransferase